MSGKSNTRRNRHRQRAESDAIGNKIVFFSSNQTHKSSRIAVRKDVPRLIRQDRWRRFLSVGCLSDDESHRDITQGIVSDNVNTVSTDQWYPNRSPAMKESLLFAVIRAMIKEEKLAHMDGSNSAIISRSGLLSSSNENLIFRWIFTSHSGAFSTGTEERDRVRKRINMYHQELIFAPNLSHPGSSVLNTDVWRRQLNW